MDDFPSSVGEHRATLPAVKCMHCGKDYVPRSAVLVTACEACLAKPLTKPVNGPSPDEAA